MRANLKDANKTSAKEDLLIFKKILDKELKKYFQIKIREAGKLSPLTEELCEYIADLTLRGGKRIRSALLYYSYLAHGGTNKKEALKAAMSMELSETYLLIHDDIMDCDKLRRGGETIHVKYERKSREKYPFFIDSHRFGLSLAITAGDIASAMSNEILASLNFKPEYIKNALLELNRIYVIVCYGQALDIYSQVREDLKKDDVLLTHQLKTVPYTFDGPIKIGAMLAGKNKVICKKLEKYSIPLGIAFQIQDDILGLFGSEEKLGKPVISDLREGKKTLLILDALAVANKSQKKIINQNLGNKKATQKELDKIRQIVKSTGALDQSKKMAEELVKKSIKAMGSFKLKKEGKDFLLKIAEYMIKREY
ncbi:MAG: polyprenyl synthetase family protein [Patescibacteria group bacterium]|nr:polyprenyl synthetase family protein [Patescibacteria group bacterium]